VGYDGVEYPTEEGLELASRGDIGHVETHGNEDGSHRDILDEESVSGESRQSGVQKAAEFAVDRVEKGVKEEDL